MSELLVSPRTSVRAPVHAFLGTLPFVLMLIATFSGPVLAQTHVNNNPLVIHAVIDAANIHADTAVPVRIQLELDPAYHAYKEQFELKVLQPEGATASTFVLKPLVHFFDKVSKSEREGIHEHGDMFFNLTLAKNTSPGEHTAELEVRFQACAADHCLFPKKIKTSVQFQVAAKSGEALVPAKTDWDVESLLNQHSWRAFLAIFFFGILTSFTPCIFPMIPITLSVIGARSVGSAEQNTSRISLRGFVLSVIYVLGIAITYAALGLFAAKTGALFGALLGNPIVVTVIAIVFVAMGLSMYGLFDIQVPAFIRDSIGAKHTDAGYVGAFVSGLISGVVAGPCVGPILVSVLTFVARAQNMMLGFSLLFTYACGLGLIFIVLGTFSGLLARLPKGGAWMKVSNFIFGTSMIALAIYYVYPVLSPRIASVATHNAASAPASSLPWKTYAADQFDQARAEGKPLILDFSADWCQACKELERYTYSDPRVQDEATRFKLYLFDATQESELLTSLRKQYDILGLPTLLFFGHDGKLRSSLTLTGFESAEQFLERMKKAEL